MKYFFSIIDEFSTFSFHGGVRSDVMFSIVLLKIICLFADLLDCTLSQWKFDIDQSNIIFNLIVPGYYWYNFTGGVWWN